MLVALSGGKDSLSMLHMLREYQRRSPVPFEIAACTVDPQTPEFDPRPLIPYLRALGVAYYFESQPIIRMAETKLHGDSICAFCARMKRGALYSVARRAGCNVLALGQHMDDLAESFVMSCFHNGKMRTMKAHYVIQKEDLRVIRPLCMLRERQLREFATTVELPVITDNCPACFSAPTERYRVKKLLASQERMYPKLFEVLFRSMRPLIDRGNAEDDEDEDGKV